MLSKLRRLMGGNFTIISNAGSLVGTNAVTSILGFAYWWVAAHWFAPDAVGFSAAAVSAMMLLGYLSMMGLGTLLIREIPRHRGREGALIVTGLVVSGIAGATIGALFAILAPLASPGFAWLGAGFATMPVFALGVALTAMTLVLDQALVGLLRGGMQFWRNALFASAKLVMLFAIGLWLADKSWELIYATWMGGNLISVGLLVGIATRSSSSEQGWLPQWEIMRGLGRAAVSHHFLNLASLAPGQILPVLVTVMLSAQSNAHFYMSWMVSSFVFVGTTSLTTALYAVGARDPVNMARRSRFTLALSAAVAVVAGGAIIVAAETVLGLFGQEYAAEATWSLRFLALAAFPLGIKAQYAVIWRIRGRLLVPGLWVAAGGLLEIAASAVGAVSFGLTGLSLGWFAATCLEAIFMGWVVFRVAFPGRIPAPEAASGIGEDLDNNVVETLSEEAGVR